MDLSVTLLMQPGRNSFAARKSYGTSLAPLVGSPQHAGHFLGVAKVRSVCEPLPNIIEQPTRRTSLTREKQMSSFRFTKGIEAILFPLPPLTSSGERATVAPKRWLRSIPALLARGAYPPKSASWDLMRWRNDRRVRDLVTSWPSRAYLRMRLDARGYPGWPGATAPQTGRIQMSKTTYCPSKKFSLQRTAGPGSFSPYPPSGLE